MKCKIGDSLKSTFKRFFVQEKGAIAILTGLVFVLLIGFAALAIDVGIWYSEKRQLQFAADAGAIGGAIALKTTGKSTINSYATNDINLNSCTSGNSCTIVAINNPPTSGTSAGNTNAVEVLLTQPADIFLGNLFLGTAPTLHARAVAGLQPSDNCIVALATTGAGITVSGNGSINSSKCGVASNSSDKQSAITVSGNGNITASTVSVVGGTKTSGNATITPSATTGAAAASDPYSGLQIPSFSGCTQSKFKLSGATQTINPGVYCDGIQLSGKSNLTMNPGIYYMDQGGFDVSGQSTVTGQGVTIILTSSTGSGYGDVKISGGATLDLSAPTTGTTAGILFFGDRNASNIDADFSGGTTQTLNGALYFPTGDVKYSGQAAGSGTPCLKIIASTMTFTGGSSFGNSCSGSTGNSGIVQLLE